MRTLAARFERIATRHRRRAGVVKTEFHSIQSRDMTAVPNVMEAADVVNAFMAGLELG
jgi:hypothetical protein